MNSRTTGKYYRDLDGIFTIIAILFLLVILTIGMICMTIVNKHVIELIFILLMLSYPYYYFIDCLCNKLRSFIEIENNGITFIEKNKIIKTIRWDEIEKVEKKIVLGPKYSQRQIIIMLKNDSEILNCRKKIIDSLKRYIKVKMSSDFK